jgi:hypothetical protein
MSGSVTKKEPYHASKEKAVIRFVERTGGDGNPIVSFLKHATDSSRNVS